MSESKIDLEQFLHGLKVASDNADFKVFKYLIAKIKCKKVSLESRHFNNLLDQAYESGPKFYDETIKLISGKVRDLSIFLNYLRNFNNFNDFGIVWNEKFMETHLKGSYNENEIMNLIIVATEYECPDWIIDQLIEYDQEIIPKAPPVPVPSQTLKLPESPQAYPFIFPKCYPATESDQTHCFHYWTNTRYDRPILTRCYHDFETQEPNLDIEYEGPLCVGLSDQEFERIRQECPVIETPIFPQRPLIFTKYFSSNQASREMKEIAEGDCWAIHIRDSTTQVIIKELYNFNKIHSGPDRARFMDLYFGNYLLQELSPKRELVFVQGRDFQEYIFRKLPDSEDKFLVIQYHYNTYRRLQEQNQSKIQPTI